MCSPNEKLSSIIPLAEVLLVQVFLWKEEAQNISTSRIQTGLKIHDRFVSDLSHRVHVHEQVMIMILHSEVSLERFLKTKLH